MPLNPAALASSLRGMPSAGAPAGGNITSQLQARAAARPQAAGVMANALRTPPSTPYQGYSTNAMNPAVQRQQAMGQAMQGLLGPGGSGSPDQARAAAQQAGMSMGGAPGMADQARAAQQSWNQGMMGAYGGGPAMQGQDAARQVAGMQGPGSIPGMTQAAQGMMKPMQTAYAQPDYGQMQNQQAWNQAAMGDMNQAARAQQAWGQGIGGMQNQMAGQQAAMGGQLQSGNLGSLGGNMLGAAQQAATQMQPNQSTMRSTA